MITHDYALHLLKAHGFEEHFGHLSGAALFTAVLEYTRKLETERKATQLALCTNPKHSHVDGCKECNAELREANRQLEAELKHDWIMYPERVLLERIQKLEVLEEESREEAARMNDVAARIRADMESGVSKDKMVAGLKEAITKAIELLERDGTAARRVPLALAVLMSAEDFGR